MSTSTPDASPAPAEPATSPVGFWNKPGNPALRQSLLLAVVAPIVVVVVYAICLLLIDRESLQWFHGETGPVEIVTALVFLSAGLLAIWMAVRIRKVDPQTPKYVVAAYLLIAVVSLFMLGEEISYGQHFLGFDSPEVFEEHNKQGEMNLHNLFDDKPSSTLRQIANIGLPVLGIALPIFLALQPWGYRRPNWSWYLMPRMELVVWVVFSILISPFRKLGGFSEGYDHHWRGTFSEFKELLWAMTGLVLLLVLVRRLFMHARSSTTISKTDNTTDTGSR